MQQLTLLCIAHAIGALPRLLLLITLIVSYQTVSMLMHR